MFQDEEQMQTAKPMSADREPYRRLIELQKQMIELVQRHERTKRECSALREQLLEEMAGPRRWPWNPGRETRWLRGFMRVQKSRRAGRPQPDGSPLPSC